MDTKHVRQKRLYSFLLMFLFGIVFFSFCAFDKNAESKILDPTVITTFNLFAVNEQAQTNELLYAERPESIFADRLYCQLNSTFEGENYHFDGMVTVRYRFDSLTDPINEVLKSSYVKADVGTELYSDGFILDIPDTDGEIILSFEGMGISGEKQAEFLQTASVEVNNGAIKINYLPHNSVLFKNSGFDSFISKTSMKIISLFVFLAALANFIYSLIDINKQNNRFLSIDAVPIDKPINLLKSKVIRLYKPDDLKNISVKRNKEILVYVFSSKLSYYYILANEVTYLYVRNSRRYLQELADDPIKKRRHSDVSIS